MTMTNSPMPRPSSPPASFFKRFPDTIFAPLAGSQRQGYLELILFLYRSFFDEASDLIEIAVPPRKVRDAIGHFVASTSDLWLFEEDILDDQTEKTLDLSSKVQRIYQRLIETGWLKLDKEGLKTQVYMSPSVSELCEFLAVAGQNVAKQVGGSVFAIHQTLKGVLAADALPADQAAGLDKALEDSVAIARRMNRLAAYMREVTEQLNEQLMLGNKVSLFFDAFIKESSFADFKDIKNQNHPFRFKTHILAVIDQMEFDSVLNQRLHQSLQRDSDLTPAQAQAKLLQTLHKIRTIFHNTEHLLARIDHSHGRLVRRVSEAIKYSQRTPVGLAHDFKQALATLAQYQQVCDRQNSLEEVIPTTAHPLAFPKALGGEALAMIRRKKAPPIAFIQQGMRQISLRKQVYTELKRAYSQRLFVTDAGLEAWLVKQWQHKQQASQLTHSKTVFNLYSTELAVKQLEDFVYFATARRLGIRSHQMQSKFKQTLKRYQFTPLGEEAINHGWVTCKAFVVECKRHTKK